MSADVKLAAILAGASAGVPAINKGWSNDSHYDASSAGGTAVKYVKNFANTSSFNAASLGSVSSVR